MSAGVGSPLGFWVGGVGRGYSGPPPGVRSPFAFWIGGAGSVTVIPTRCGPLTATATATELTATAAIELLTATATADEHTAETIVCPYL